MRHVYDYKSCEMANACAIVGLPCHLMQILSLSSPWSSIVFWTKRRRHGHARKYLLFFAFCASCTIPFKILWFGDFTVIFKGINQKLMMAGHRVVLVHHATHTLLNRQSKRYP
jgi:hypothetical protein